MTPRKQTPKTPKAEDTRRRIFDAALASFAEHGYEDSTMRAIAARAGTSIGLTYRYFAKKDDLVLELYRITCIEFEQRVQGLPEGDLGARFIAAMEQKLALVAPHRAVFAAVVAATMDPHGRAFALGEAAADVRGRIVEIWKYVVAGSRDAAPLPDKDGLAVLLLVTQLAILFFWLNDESAGQEQTRALVKQLGGALHMGLGLLFLDENAERMHAVVQLLMPVFMRR